MANDYQVKHVCRNYKALNNTSIHIIEFGLYGEKLANLTIMEIKDMVVRVQRDSMRVLSGAN